MSDLVLMPEVETALAQAVQARGPAPAPTRRRSRWWTRRAGMLAIGAVVISGSAVATTGIWQPTLGDPQHGGQPRPARADVPAEQRALLGVLRRPQTQSDRGPLVRAALQRLDRRFINGIHVDGIRVLLHTRREIAVLVPAERVGQRVDGVPEAKTRFRDVLCLLSSSYAPASSVPVRRHGKLTHETIPAGFRGWGMSCGDVEQLRTTGIETGTSLNAPARYFTTTQLGIRIRRIVLVPDGVASASVRLRGGRWTTVPVHDNIYKYEIHGFPAMLGTIWYDRAGNKIDHRRRR
jgi:hypothetical protein